jgi:hypothetical protein
VTDIDLEPDLEDMINTELVLEDSPAKYDAWIPLDSAGVGELQEHAKRIHKASILRMYSSPLATMGSKDHLRRNRGHSSYDDVISTAQQSNGNFTSNTDVLTIKDPIATLLQCNQQVFLAIGQVIDLHSGSSAVQIIPIDELQELNVHIRVQIMRLATVSAPEACNNSEDNTSIILDWEWTGALSNYWVHLQHRSLMGDALNLSMLMLGSHKVHQRTIFQLKSFVDLPCCYLNTSRMMYRVSRTFHLPQPFHIVLLMVRSGYLDSDIQLD